MLKRLVKLEPCEETISEFTEAHGVKKQAKPLEAAQEVKAAEEVDSHSEESRS